MGPEKVKVAHSQAQLFLCHGASEVSRSRASTTLPKTGKELCGSERRRLGLKQMGFERKRSRVAIIWNWVKRGRKTET